MTAYRFTIPGAPPRKNRRHQIVLGRLINSASFNDLVERVAQAWGARPMIDRGAWSVTIAAQWKRTRHLDLAFAFGDVDASASSIFDSLQQAGVIDDDVRIAELRCSKAIGADGVEVELRRIDV
jgi:hypothetical protein